MSDFFIGEMRLFSFGFAPHGWAFCNGAILSATQNSALYSLLQNMYGGNPSQHTFALPDVRGRVVVGVGQASGRSAYEVGQQGGGETVSLTVGHLPAHAHAVVGSRDKASTDQASNAYWGSDGLVPAYGAFAASESTQISSATVTSVGGGEAHGNIQPSLVMNYCIAIYGMYPVRS